jgi:hypothetical protein
MVALNNLLPKGNKQQNNAAVYYSENLNIPESPLKNPDYNKNVEIHEHGPNNTYNIDVHYSTDLTHPELAPQNPVPNPVLERTKTLSPIQQITIIGRGIDPNVITNHPTKINHYVREKEQSTETQTLDKTQITTQTTNLTPQEVLGPFVKGFNSGNLNAIANQVLQITNGLTLPELFQILGFDINEWIPHNNNRGFYGGFSLDNASISIQGNTIWLQYQVGSGWYAPGGGSGSNITTRFIEISNVNGYVIIKYVKNVEIENNGIFNETNFIRYYVINPKTRRIVYESSTYPEIIAQPPAPTHGDIVQPSQVISNILQQYGYQLTSQELQEIDNLQPGQSITVNAYAGSTGAQFKITYLGNNQYQIQSVGEFYNFNDFNNPWTSINETVTVPAYSINQQTGQISTTNLSISGQVTTYGTTNINEPYYTATYNVNETIPVYSSSYSGQIGFWFGNPQGGASLQSLSVPTLTYQQYIELANGQMPPGIKPGWYYYPTLHEFVYVTPPQYTLSVGNLKITNPEVISFIQQYGNNNVLVTNLRNIGDPNELAFIYVNSNGNGEMLIYNTITGQVVDKVSIKNLQTGNPDYDLIVQTIYYQQYYPSNNQLITFQIASNNLNSYANSNEPIADILGSTPVYVTVDLVNNTIYLQNVLGQVISTKTFKNQSSMLSYLQNTYGISPLSVIAAENPQVAQITTLTTQVPPTNINSIYQYSNFIPGTTTINMPGSTINNVPFTIPSQQPQYITGVMTLPVKLSKQQIEKNELQNIIWESQEIEQEVSNNQAYGGPTGLGIDTYATLAQAFADIGLKQPAQFFLNLAQQALEAGTPANVLANVIGLGEILGSIAMIEYSGPEEIGILSTSSITEGISSWSILKNFIMSGATTTAFGNLISYTSKGKLLSPEEDIFLFTTSGLAGAGGSLLGNIVSKSLTNIGITGLGNNILSELVGNTIVGAGTNIALGETLSLQNTGKWLPLSEVGLLAETGAEYGALASAVDLGLRIFAPSLSRNPLGSSLAAGAVNALFALPSRNPLMILGAFDIGLISGGLNRMIEFSQIPYLLESPEAQRVLDTTEAGWRLGKDLKERMIAARLVSEKDAIGWTTTQTIQKLKEIYNDLQEKIIERELSPQDIEYLRSKGILGIRNDIILGKEEDFAKYVKDKVPDGEKYYNTQQIIKYVTKQLDKMFGGWKISLGEKTLLYRIKSGDRTIWGFGSAGKAEEFISERSVSDILLNVAGIYNAPSDVIDTIKYLRRNGMYEDAEMLEKIYESVKSIKDVLSKIKPSKNLELEFRDYAEEYAKKYGPEYGELISTQMGDTIKEYIQENFGKDAVIYGSESVRQYLDDIARRYGGKVVRVGKDYVIIDRHGNVVWKFRMPGDVDIVINTRDPGVLEKAAEDIAKLLNKALNTDRFVAQEHLVIDKYRGGEHVVDLHMPNEGSKWLNIYARKSNFYDLGFPRPEPYYTDKVGVARLSQTLLDKASAVASLRQLSLADLVDTINSGAKIDNPNYVISFLRNLLKNADYETQRNVLAEFVTRLKPEYRNTYIGLISNSFNIPVDQLTYVDPTYRDIVNQYFYKKQTYIAPATYRLKDTGDTLSLTYLGGKLAKSKEVMENYETIKEIAKEKGILPKDWTEPNEINMEEIFKSINPFESNIQAPETIRAGSLIGSLGSMFGSEESITGASIVSSILNGPSASNKSSSIRSISLSESESIISSISSIASTSESLTKSLSLSSSLSESFSFSPSLSISTSQSLSTSASTSMSTSISTSTSTSTSISTSLSSSISASIFSTSGSPSYFGFFGFGGLSNPTTDIGINLGNAKRAESDVAYAFNKLWR